MNTYEKSEFKKLIDMLKEELKEESKEETFKNGFESLDEQQKAYIEEKAKELVLIDRNLQTKLKVGNNMLKNLFIFQLQVLGDYLINIKIVEHDIEGTLHLMTQKFSELVDISTKGLLSSGFNSDPRNNMTVLTGKLKPFGISQYLKSSQVQAGGSITDYKKIIEDLTKIYTIFNSDLLLKTMSLLSAEKKILQTGGPELMNIMKDFALLLFINMSENSLNQKLKTIHKTLESKMIRDTMIYTKISETFGIQPAQNMILIKTFFDSLKLEDELLLSQYLSTKDLSEDFLKLLTQFITRLEPISNIYKILYNNYVTINILYDIHVEDKKKVFAYVKERNAVGVRNKRFAINETNKFLNLKYTANDTDDTLAALAPVEPEYYYFGPYTNTFLNNKTNVEIAEGTSELILSKLIDKREHIFILGYGQSGAGKTSTLINSDYIEGGERIQELGLIPLILNTERFRNGVDNIKMKVIEIYNNIVEYVDLTYIDKPDADKIDAKKFSKPMNYTNDLNDYEYTFTNKNGEWKNNAALPKVPLEESIQHYMVYCVDKRRTYPTSNNPDSSRSHILIFLECIKDGNKSYLICGDLAGVENSFDCTDKNIIKKFVTSFGTSKKNYVCGPTNCIYFNIPENKEWNLDYDAAYKKVTMKVNPLLIAPKKSQALVEAEKKLENYNILKDNYDEMIRLINTILNSHQNIDTQLTSIINNINTLIDELKGFTSFKEVFINNMSKTHTLTDFFKEKIKKDNSDFNVNRKIFNNKINENIKVLETQIIQESDKFKKEEAIYMASQGSLNDKIEIINEIIKNCAHRKLEGNHINKSLKEMREDIKSVLISNFDNDTLYFDKTIFPYCINTTIKESKLDRFYTNSIGGARIKGIIMKTIQDIITPQELKKLNFIIFTIIRTDATKNYNNPPEPPYINTNDLYYNTHVDTDPIKLLASINDTVAKAKSTKFYNKPENEFKTPPVYPTDFNKLKPIAEGILTQIDNNNDATLIGSLISTEKLNNLIFDKMICSYNSKFDDILEQFNPQKFPVTSTPISSIFSKSKSNTDDITNYNQSIVRKYMKYKNKYIMKLKSRALKK